MGDITRAELASLGLRAAATRGIDTADLDAAIDAASQKARSYLRGRYPTLGTITDPGYKEAVAKIATHIVLCARGFDPRENRVNELVVDNMNASLRWLRDVADGRAHLDVPEVVGETFGPTLAAEGESDPSRGW